MFRRETKIEFLLENEKLILQKKEQAFNEKIQIAKLEQTSELFDRKVEAEINAEIRATNKEINSEKRDQMYFEKRLVLEIEAKVNEEQRALGRQLKAEERANIEADEVVIPQVLSDYADKKQNLRKLLPYCLANQIYLIQK